MPAPDRVQAMRVVSTPAALDSATWSEESLVLRVAPDEALVVDGPVPFLSDPHAVVEAEEGLVGVELGVERVREWLSREADWEVSDAPGLLHQGMAAGIPVKISVGSERALVLTRASLRHVLERRL